MSSNTEPVRELECQFDDNGQPSWRSFPTHKNIQVRGACDLPPHLPGIIILVHGVNSTGEWYTHAETALCKGLNGRLGLNSTPYELKPNKYASDAKMEMEPLTPRELPKPEVDKSPIIRFYWGYSSVKGEEDKYVIPLANNKGDDYHQLKRQGVSHKELMEKGPFFWGGGPFQNGTNNLYTLWSEQGFDENMLGIPGVKTQWVTDEQDRLLTNAPPRKYYAHAAKRLADLLNQIREKYPKDTVSIISHSQGTMVAMAATAIAKQAPDTLFILNSPYALDNPQLYGVYLLPSNECISVSGRESTLSAIVSKVAERATHLSNIGYDGLCVGQSQDKKNWRPDIQHTLAGEEAVISERDNHGRTWIYFCPHDRVMGSLPLRSVGWQGLPNDNQGKPHKLLSQHQGHLFQRMLARNMPCGEAPDSHTPFAHLPDGNAFWDDKGDQYQSSSTTYPDPPAGQTVFVNAERVPEPIKASELAGFDETRVGREHDKKQADGWGETKKDKQYKNDNTYDNYINLYPNQDVVIGFKNVGTEKEPRIVPVTREETFEEKDLRLRTYVSQPTDHSTLPGHAEFMARVVAYDLPIGYCDATWDKEFMNELRTRADWTQGLDPYLQSGVLDEVEKPAMISSETMLEEMIRIKSKQYGH